MDVYAISDEHYVTLPAELDEWEVPWTWVFGAQGDENPHFEGVDCVLLVLSRESVDSEAFCATIKRALRGPSPVVVVKTSLHCRTPVPLRDAKVIRAAHFTADAVADAIKRAAVCRL